MENQRLPKLVAALALANDRIRGDAFAQVCSHGKLP